VLDARRQQLRGLDAAAAEQEAQDPGAPRGRRAGRPDEVAEAVGDELAPPGSADRLQAMRVSADHGGGAGERSPGECALARVLICRALDAPMERRDHHIARAACGTHALSDRARRRELRPRAAGAGGERCRADVREADEPDPQAEPGDDLRARRAGS